ncbi:DUF3073 domain-containing protein [Nocardia stercoris]|uniref:DUF3073 domain-containing protein n=1 Tax=Nocardia stercoris TaxID=2483361 RepID=A0A3M2L507_9NOCA|nr:DUF3073 domain-containing protein [Nocardia stercoris]RMI29608.1 DUF3073 domain-containing protein [Nocardia stercoris]
MGRGRAKAKQTKVARELKYSSTPTDFASLQRELSGPAHESPFGGRVMSDEQDAKDSLPRWSDDDYDDDWRG